MPHSATDGEVNAQYLRDMAESRLSGQAELRQMLLIAADEIDRLRSPVSEIVPKHEIAWVIRSCLDERLMELHAHKYKVEKIKKWLRSDCASCGRPATKEIADACGQHPCPLNAAPDAEAASGREVPAAAPVAAPDGFKLLPKEPSEAMIRAIDAYFAKWQDIVGGSDTKRKADCWSAFQVYKLMYEAADTSRSATAGFAETITASVMNASPAARLEACAPFNAAPQDVAGVKARCDIDAQHPAVAAPLSQSDKPEGLPFCRVCGSRENEPCPYHTLKSGCPHGVPMVYARSSVATNEGETPRTDAVVVQTRMEAAAEKYETSWGIAFIALRDHSRQLERELVALTRHFHEEREQYEARLYARSARGENDALDAKRYRFLRDGEPNATFITSRETRARYVADDDVDLDRYIDDALREYVEKGKIDG